MRKHNRFERTGKGTVFACETCGRNTRMAGQGNDALCPECWELAGIDNQVNDNGSEALANVVAERDALLRKAVARGGDEAAIKASCTYLWPTNKPHRVGWHTGLTGDGVDVPDWLLVKNRKPLTAEQQAKLAASQHHQAQPERFDGRKPKGMAWSDWDAYLQGQHKATDAAPLPTPRGAPSARKAPGLLDANHFAPLCGCEPKVVRRALRTLKTLPKPAHGWCFPKEDEAKVIAVVKAYLAGKGKGKPAAAPAATPTPEPVKSTSKLAKAQATLATAKATLDKSVARQAKDAPAAKPTGAAKREAKGLPPTKAKRARK